jgi:hypothetical protein
LNDSHSGLMLNGGHPVGVGVFTFGESHSDKFPQKFPKFQN